VFLRRRGTAHGAPPAQADPQAPLPGCPRRPGQQDRRQVQAIDPPLFFATFG
jgi:hypothetical protein